MNPEIRWKVSSNYIGAGRFVASRDRLVLGTEYGVECIPLASGSGKGWEAELGSRCVGVAEGEDGTIFAGCVGGLHALNAEGRECWGAHSFKEIVTWPVPFEGGVLFTSRDAIHYHKEWDGLEWRFDFSDVLGRSVESIRVVNLFGMDQYVVVGAVDYDSGIGRVLVLHGKGGRRVWMSDPGPISDVFPAGRGVFVWSQTGYGKFETRMTRLDGHEIWQKDVAGLGALRPDGSIVLVVGSNESPAWDDWEYRQFSPGGKTERALKVRGRCFSRPLCRVDGSVLLVGLALPPEISGTRSGDVRFFKMPQEELFQHLMGIRPQIPIFDLYVQVLAPDAERPEVRYHRPSTFSLADLRILDGALVFADGTDIVALEVG